MRWCSHHRTWPLVLVSIVILGVVFTPVLVIGGGGGGGGDSEKSSINILVPLKLGFQEFVRWASIQTPPTNASLTFSGFAIEVFERCVEKLDYSLNYTFIGYGDGITDPSYKDLLQALVDTEVYTYIHTYKAIYIHISKQALFVGKSSETLTLRMYICLYMYTKRYIHVHSSYMHTKNTYYRCMHSIHWICIC